jgi:holo-[acyl-carrier protein] synthase
MIIGIGIDIVEVNRIATAVKRKGFLQKVFTDTEREYCQSRGRNSAASYAARFAGKEAVAKAFGTGFYPGEAKEIEIVNNKEGCPGVILHGGFLELSEKMGVAKIYISLTHSKEYAAAQAILWGSVTADESSN